MPLITNHADYVFILGVPNVANYASNAALIAVPKGGGEIVYTCIAEERLAREKNTYAFPLRAIDRCLDEMGLASLHDVDHVVTDYARVPRWINSGPGYRKLDHDYLKAKLDYPVERIQVLRHHDAHAACCFYPSGFDEAAILTIDGMGSDLETQCLYHGRDGGVELVERAHGWGVGKLYAMVTGNVLPYGPEKGWGKVMGLASYGADQPGPVLDFQCRDDGMTTDYSAFYSRQPVSRQVQPVQSCTDRSRVMEPYFLRAAYDVQEECERQLIRMAHYAHEKTGSTRLCLSGGVILNGRANHRILEETPFEEIWMAPCSCDTGYPLGLALLAAYEELPGMPDNLTISIPHAYTGHAYTDDEITTELGHWGVEYAAADADTVAGMIAAGRVVAWFDEGSEVGPRALGHRSILADPRSEAMKDVLNAGVKFREAYRPYAPSVLTEHATDWFDLLAPSPFMLLVTTVKADKRDQVPAITHVDGTARVQEVSAEHSPRYWDLISAFHYRTGVPMVLNTSFNLNREPIVETPIDALICAFKTQIDVLVFNGTMLVDCAAYRDPALVQHMMDGRQARLDDDYARICDQHLSGYDESERDDYLAKENEIASWHLVSGARYETEKFVLDCRGADRRVLICGTAGHTQALYEYIDGFCDLNVVACVDPSVGPGEPGVLPPEWPVIELADVDRECFDVILISTHEYQRETAARVAAVAAEKPVCCLYDSAMDSLYFTLPERGLKLHHLGESHAIGAMAVRQIDEVAGDTAPDVAAISERYAFVLNYHYVRPEDAGPFDGMKGCTPADLEAHCRQLADNFPFVTASELVDPTRDLPESVAMIAFDDSIRDVVDHAAPVLKTFGIRATVFVPTEPYTERRVIETHKRHLIAGRLGPERFRAAFYDRLDGVRFEREDPAEIGVHNPYIYDDEDVRRFKIDLNYAIPYAVLTPILDDLFAEVFGPEDDIIDHLYVPRDDLLRLQDLGWELGGHSHRHQVLSRLSPEAQADDLRINRDALADRFERAPRAFAYPFGIAGTWNSATIDGLQAAGFESAFTLGRDIVRPSDLAGRFEIPRFDNRDLFDDSQRLQHAKLEVLSTGD